ncbi:MAG: ABC transporter ATP-binding protein [Hyphomonadaceae bacterium]|jgi:branched-chain amino acid transport system ATP-binding protein/neutral amino acid transport system ATP-binding protein|nr:ABC transporter ATP-binding protein [Hyphomonadaceae bacterium]
MSLLSLKSVRAGYGSADIIQGVDLNVVPAETVALLGPNGAGKSTLLKAIAGVARVSSGSVTFDGQSLTALSPAERAAAGVAFLPQDRNVFRTLSVAENLAVSAWGCADAAARIEEVLRLLPNLSALMRKPAGRLSGGQRQMVALAMALMARPRILLVDEPTAGLSPRLVGETLDLLLGLAQAGLGILIVEQNARAALTRVQRALILVDGKVVRSGAASDLAAEPDFGRLFFGEAA